MDLTGDNAELISRLRLGDPASWDDLRSTIQRLVLPRVLGARALDREEILTDVTSNLWLSLGSLRDGNKLLAFATTIARRVVARKLEGLSRHVPLASEPTGSEGPGLGRLESLEVLERVAGSLRAADWALFKLLYVSGASSEEVQRTLSVTPAMLRQRKHRLQRRIEGEKGRKEPGDSAAGGLKKKG